MVAERKFDAPEGTLAGFAELLASRIEELRELRREVKRLKMEREILKAAATFFAKENG